MAFCKYRFQNRSTAFLLSKESANSSDKSVFSKASFLLSYMSNVLIQIKIKTQTSG